MNKILDLREKRAKAWEAAKAFLDTKRGENGLISAEDNTVYEKMESDVVALGKEIDRLERQEALDREMSLPLSTPLTSKPENGMNQDEKGGRASDGYKKNFWNAMRTKAPTAEILNALTEGTDTEGGYLVPAEFERTLVKALEENNIFRTMAHIIRTNSGDRLIPIVTSHGAASWVAEGGSYQESNEAFGQVTIGAHKVGTMIKISEELMNDSAFDLEAYMVSEFARRIGNAEEEAFITGNGTGKPTGILGATGGAQVGVTTAGAAAITCDEIISTYHSLGIPYRKKAVWLMNDSTVQYIRKLKDGNGSYIWQPSIVAGTPDTILGCPVKVSRYMPEIAATNKTIAFGDFEYYWIADRQGRSFKRLDELFAATGQVGFRGSQRVDGKLILSEAIKLLQQKA